MILVKKDFNEIPEVLFSSINESWKDITVINKLKELYHWKCAYCETKTEDLIIEHYRPKAGIDKKDTGRVANKGYYWLVNEWTNLLLSCEACNGKAAKGNRYSMMNLQMNTKGTSFELEKQ
jgi:5-methylcytosine-specific restriction endonuclease McrA